jgi:hypothetical protein
MFGLTGWKLFGGESLQFVLTDENFAEVGDAFNALLPD